MLNFWVADLDATGELLSKQAYDYATLERIPGSSELIGHFSGQIYRTPGEFESAIPDTGGELVMRWYGVAETAGVATLRSRGEVLAMSLLATGRDARADIITLETFQRHLVHLLHDTGHEPAFGLVGIEERPLVATINLGSPEGEVPRLLSALADRCFAAAFFRYHHLA